MRKLFFNLLLAFSVMCLALNAAEQSAALGAAPAGTKETPSQVCEYEAKVAQFHCLETPEPSTDCFLSVMDNYESCCKSKHVACPVLKF